MNVKIHLQRSDVLESINVWNADVYDKKLSFVSRYGKGILELLQPKKGEKILDLGCGTGDLSEKMSKSGADVVGIDASAKMIEKARTKYPNITFQIVNAESFRRREKFDAVFSNAALHWIKQSEKVIKTIEQALKPGGRFVAEFGGLGNERPTILPDGEKGLEYWLDSFADDFFPEFSSQERTEIYRKIKQKLNAQLFTEGNWVADYKRLQVIAVKN